MGKAMEPLRTWMITGIQEETNGWETDTLQMAGVQKISWLVSVWGFTFD